MLLSMVLFVQKVSINGITSQHVMGKVNEIPIMCISYETGCLKLDLEANSWVHYVNLSMARYGADSVQISDSAFLIIGTRI